MIKIIDGIRFFYSFSSPGGFEDPKNKIYINRLGGMVFAEGKEPLLQFKNLDALLATTAGVSGFLKAVIESNRNVAVFIDERDMSRLIGYILCGLFPGITEQMFHLIHHCLIVDCKVGRTNNYLKGEVDRDGYEALKVPTPALSRIIYAEAKHQTPFSNDIKEKAGAEYLLANALAVGYSVDDVYVEVLRSKLEASLWDTLLDDHKKRQRKKFLCVFDREIYDLDPLSDDFEQEVLAQERTFSERTKETAAALIESITEIDTKNKIYDSFKQEVLSYFQDDGTLSTDELVRLLKEDRKRPWSLLASACNLTKDSNALLLSYLHGATSKDVECLSLTAEK